MRSDELKQAISQCWQVLHLLEITSKSSHLENMAVEEIDTALQGIIGILLNAVMTLEEEV